MKKRLNYAAILLLFLSPIAQSAAISPATEKTIPFDWALTVAQTVSQACFEKGFASAITVADQRLQLMREGAFPHTAHTSRQEAKTAASRRLPTVKVVEIYQHEPAHGDALNEIGLTVLSGGLPITHQGNVIGGIGIAGTPSEDENGRGMDRICSEIGIAKITQFIK
jgi:uncharacterized protein GlcG (DUF336 family)